MRKDENLMQKKLKKGREKGCQRDSKPLLSYHNYGEFRNIQFAIP